MTYAPVFFIHPCQTASLMQDSVENKEVTAYEYLALWISATGACVGLHMPIALVASSIASPLSDTGF